MKLRARHAISVALLTTLVVMPCRADDDADTPPSHLGDAEWKPDQSGVGRASADAPETVDQTAHDPARRLLNTAVAIGPGAIVHGAGHVAAGRTETGRHLALAQLTGLGTMVGGLAGLALTGASRYVVGPLAVVTIAGAGLFFLPWAADIYGTAAGPDGAGTAPRLAPVLVSELGHRYVYDPQFRYRHFLVESVDLRVGRLRLAPSAWFALDDDNARVRMLAAWRLTGPTPHEVAPDGSFVDLEAAVTHQRFDSDGFRSLTGEVSVSTRADLAGWDSALAGSFVEAGTGLALQRFEYRVPGVPIDPETNDLLLLRFAFGFYLGRGANSGEAQLFYDHRHDDYAAGLKVPGLGSGVAGHLGFDVRQFFGDLGVRVEGQVGSAAIFGASLLFRQGVN